MFQYTSIHINTSWHEIWNDIAIKTVMKFILSHPIPVNDSVDPNCRAPKKRLFRLRIKWSFRKVHFSWHVRFHYLCILWPGRIIICQQNTKHKAQFYQVAIQNPSVIWQSPPFPKGSLYIIRIHGDMKWPSVSGSNDPCNMMWYYMVVAFDPYIDCRRQPVRKHRLTIP